MRNKRAIICLTLSLVWGLQGAGYSASFQIVQFNDNQNSPIPFGLSTRSTGVDPVSDSASLTYDGLADSGADFLVLHSYLRFEVSAEGSFTIQNGPSAHTSVLRTDQIVVTGGSGGGTLRGTLTIEGNSSVHGSGGYHAGLASVAYPGGFAFTTGNVEFTVPFTFGDPTPIYFDIGVFVDTFGFGSPLPPSGGVADFSTILGPLEILDADMQPVTGLVQSYGGSRTVDWDDGGARFHRLSRRLATTKALIRFSSVRTRIAGDH
jgi:hypothetical protein